MIRFFTEKPAKNVVETDEVVSAATDEEEDDNKENGVGFAFGICAIFHLI